MHGCILSQIYSFWTCLSRLPLRRWSIIHTQWHGMKPFTFSPYVNVLEFRPFFHHLPIPCVYTSYLIIPLLIQSCIYVPLHIPCNIESESMRDIFFPSSLSFQNVTLGIYTYPQQNTWSGDVTQSWLWTNKQNERPICSTLSNLSR